MRHSKLSPLTVSACNRRVPCGKAFRLLSLNANAANEGSYYEYSFHGHQFVYSPPGTCITPRPRQRVQSTWPLPSHVRHSLRPVPSQTIHSFVIPLYSTCPEPPHLIQGQEGLPLHEEQVTRPEPPQLSQVTSPATVKLMAVKARSATKMLIIDFFMIP